MSKGKNAKESEDEIEREMREDDRIRRQAIAEYEKLVRDVLNKLSSPEAKKIAYRMLALPSRQVIRQPMRKREDAVTSASIWEGLRGKTATEVELEVLSWAQDLEQFGRVQ